MALNQDSENEEEEEDMCPICIEPVDGKGETKRFFPCPCNYRVCMFCVKRIQTEFDSRCPGCRRDYNENDFRFVEKPAPQAGKRGSKKNKYNGLDNTNYNGTNAASLNSRNMHGQYAAAAASTNPASASTGPATNAQVPTIIHNPSELQGISRKDLSNVRVVQRNLVYLVGLAPSIAKEDTLRSKEYFGKFGKILKIAINRNEREVSSNNKYDGHNESSRVPSFSAYITFSNDEDAKAAIRAVNGMWVDNYVIKASFGTTKYCNMFLRGIQCANPDCLYLHKLGDDASSFTKEEMQAGRVNFHDIASAEKAASLQQQQQQQPSSPLIAPIGTTTNPPPVSTQVKETTPTNVHNQSQNNSTSQGNQPPKVNPWGQSSMRKDEASTSKGLAAPSAWASSTISTVSIAQANEEITSQTNDPESLDEIALASGQSLLSLLGGIRYEEYMALHPHRVPPQDPTPGSSMH